MSRLIENINRKIIFGVKIGILLLDNVQAPSPIGDIRNALTYHFPVVFKIVEGATVNKVVNTIDDSLAEKFIEASRELIQIAGINAVTTACGFTAVYQEKIASSLDICVFMSSLLQVPLVSRMIGKNKKVGIITANKKRLTVKHLEAAGIEEGMPICIIGMEDYENFSKMLLGEQSPVGDLDKIEKEMVTATNLLLKTNKDIGAIVLECANMAPYASTIQKITNTPVFDLIDFIHFIYMSISKRIYY